MTHRARSGVDYCRHCDAFPRHPCGDYDFAEIARCPNAEPEKQEWARQEFLDQHGMLP